ncbi:MAG: methylmalonyl Co-A mutase-associated GTPase MeaB [Rhizobiaceae bacterium]|nr:methylmalonyl Co-A mutase-associated GTPase MeaB [Rhizobiaceae bacterium]
MNSVWRRPLAKALSTIENRLPGWRQLLSHGYAGANDAVIIGITGPPGAGKSSLIDLIASEWSKQGHRVGIIAIDPASPFSGGAVLGDRVRMRRAEDDDRIFIRSMSARGHAGGLNAAAIDLCTILKNYGITRILLETVGVGQNEVEVAFVADCTLVVSVPGLGDSVQAAKAGLLEVGDIYVVTKSDLSGASGVARDLQTMLAMVFPGSPGINLGKVDASMIAGVASPIRALLARRFGNGEAAGGAWHPPVLNVSASANEGIPALCHRVDAFKTWLDESGIGLSRRKVRHEHQLRALLIDRFMETLLQPEGPLSGDGMAGWASRVAAGMIDPHSAVDNILGKGETS